MFDDTTSCISDIYRRFQCQHHLIQEPGHVDKRPDIPSLTPGGFETWARVLMEAYPNTECVRLDKAVETFRIRDKGDLPFTINRLLFPESSDSKIREDLKRSIAEYTSVVIPDPISNNIFGVMPNPYYGVSAAN